MVHKTFAAVFFAATLTATTFIGCADQIEVPDETNTTTKTDNKLVHNHVAGTTEDDVVIDILDSNGNFVKTLGKGIVTSTGKNAILYVSGPKIGNGPADIYVADASGGNVRKVASISYAGDDGRELYGFPTISDDGSMVAYATRDSINESTSERVLHAVKSNGSGHVVISRSLDYETNFDLSPDGRRIAYYSGPLLGTGPNAQLMIGSTDGTGSTALLSGIATGGDFSMGMAWSHKSNRIAYGTQDSSYGYRVHVINVDGTGRIDMGEGMYPTWSEDDSLLAWSSKSPGHMFDIAVYKEVGEVMNYLTNTVQYEVHPQFSQDGKKILCLLQVDDDELSGTLEVIDIASHETRVRSLSSYTGFWIK